MHIGIYNIMSMHFFSKSKINTCGVVILHLEKLDFFHNVGLNCPGEKYLLIYFISVMICLYLMRYWLQGMRGLLKKKKKSSAKQTNQSFTPVYKSTLTHVSITQ